MEEAVIRRELSDNFCSHNKNYDSLTGARVWAQESLEKHATVIFQSYIKETIV